MNNNVINTAVIKINEQNQAQTEMAAQRLVAMVLGERATVKVAEAQIVGFQNQMVAIQDAVVTAEKVLGVALPDEANQNANQKTIAAVIAKLNKGAQGDVEYQSTSLLNRITTAQELVAGCNERIAELLKDLASLEAKVITPEAVVGQ